MLDATWYVVVSLLFSLMFAKSGILPIIPTKMYGKEEKISKFKMILSTIPDACIQTFSEVQYPFVKNLLHGK